MAEFQFYLNRAGAKGEKGDTGDKGDPGNTPIPSTGTNTPTEYTIVWDLGDGNSFETGNLKQPTVDQGGTTLRYDRANDQIILGEPDLASTANMTPGIVYLADDERIENEDVQDDDAVTYKVFKDETEDLQEQITELGSDLNDLSEIVTQNSEDIESLDGRLDDEEANMLIVQGDITNLNETKASKAELSSGLATKANVVHNHTMSQITDAGTLAKKNTVDYQTEVINKPTIPTPGSGVITINQGGVLKGTFNVNQNNNSTINLDAGGGSSFTAGTGLELTAQDVLNVKIDGTTITTNTSGQLVASGGGTTYTAGTGIDITNDTISVDSTIVDKTSSQTLSNKTFDEVLAISEDTDQTSLIIQNTGDDNPRIIMAGISSANQRIEVVDGQFQSIGTIAYTSDITGGSSVLKKTITQASSNVSLVGTTVTVTDADVTTSTLVSLYPGDTATETWLSNNLDSTIITEGTGSFTFSITASSLPSTFSMYYTITEVS